MFIFCAAATSDRVKFNSKLLELFRYYYGWLRVEGFEGVCVEVIIGCACMKAYELSKLIGNGKLLWQTHIPSWNKSLEFLQKLVDRFM